MLVSWVIVRNLDFILREIGSDERFRYGEGCRFDLYFNNFFSCCVKMDQERKVGSQIGDGSSVSVRGWWLDQDGFGGNGEMQGVF